MCVCVDRKEIPKALISCNTVLRVEIPRRIWTITLDWKELIQIANCIQVHKGRKHATLCIDEHIFEF